MPFRFRQLFQRFSKAVHAGLLIVSYCDGCRCQCCNGRTARLWANFLALRYGLPPFVTLRPRPDDGYEAAGARAMRGRWEPTAAAFRRMLNRFLEEFGR